MKRGGNERQSFLNNNDNDDDNDGEHYVNKSYSSSGVCEWRGADANTTATRRWIFNARSTFSCASAIFPNQPTFVSLPLPLQRSLYSVNGSVACRSQSFLQFVVLSRQLLGVVNRARRREVGRTATDKFPTTSAIIFAELE